MIFSCCFVVDYSLLQMYHAGVNSYRYLQFYLQHIMTNTKYVLLSTDGFLGMFSSSYTEGIGMI